MARDKQYNILNKKKKSTSLSSLIVDRKNITHLQDMTEHFIIFCTSVGKEIQNNIPPTKHNFKNYLKNVKPKSLYFFSDNCRRSQ